MDLFENKAKELLTLYKSVKGWIILSENITGKSTLACLNEMRNAFDHIMRSVEEGEGDSTKLMEREFGSAERHLHRAGFDAFEVIVIYKLNELHRAFDGLKPKAISLAFPEYYKRYAQEISGIQRRFGDARSNKFDLVKGEYNFEHYEKDTETLLEISDEILTYVPEVWEVQRKLDRENIGRTVRKILVGVIVGIIVTLITVKVIQSSNPSQEHHPTDHQNPPHQSDSLLSPS